ncbi:hypothetical protein [Maribacter sp. 2210JD10-5]|uniref:hypothetical protein n=1 Tax=Maribacter sp. 2210JD10-5 TaxID=3386272 RepID=UPI0039BD484D
MKKVKFIIILVSLCSCSIFQEKGITFKITNSADFPITGVKISTSENLESVSFDSIQKNESQEGFLSMKNNKMDGSYTLSYTHRDGSTKKISSGYYTNGTVLDSYIRFEITNDSALVKFGEFPDY